MRLLISFIILFITASSYAQFSSEGNAVQCKLSNLDQGEAFIFTDINLGKIIYTNKALSSASSIIWSRYYAPGIGQVNEPLTTDRMTSDSTSLIESADLGEGGYMLEFDSAGTTITKYVWIYDYDKYKVNIDSIGIYETGSRVNTSVDYCKNLILKTYHGDTTINYYKPNDTTTFVIQKETMATYKGYTEEKKYGDFKYLKIAAPYDDITFEATVFDRFSTAIEGNNDTLEMGTIVADTLYAAKAVKMDNINYSVFVDSLGNNEVEQSSEGSLGGSAPLEVTFTANNATSKVLYYDWYIRRNVDNPGTPIHFTSPEVHHTFKDMVNPGQADYYNKLIISNDYCSYTDSVDVTIIESFIDAPNFMVIKEGLPTEFRVVYKSLRTFKGYIYNRWGRKLFEWDDPSRGWDMKHRGKYVSPGVYFYVVRAKGTDGMSQNKSGSITIVRPNR